MKKLPSHRNGVRLLQPTTKDFREWLRAFNRCADSNDLVAGHAASRVSNNPAWPQSNNLAELRDFARREYGNATAAEITAAWREWRRARELAERQARGEEIAQRPMLLKNAPVGEPRWFASDEAPPAPEELRA
jgi:hypothetical protein